MPCAPTSPPIQKKFCLLPGWLPHACSPAAYQKFLRYAFLSRSSFMRRLNTVEVDGSSWPGDRPERFRARGSGAALLGPASLAAEPGEKVRRLFDTTAGRKCLSLSLLLSLLGGGATCASQNQTYQISDEL